MQRFLKYLLPVFFFFFISVSQYPSTDKPKDNPDNVVMSSCQQAFIEMDLEGIINYQAFEQAYEGYSKIKGRKKDILTVVDFSKPSTKERLYVLDMNRKKLLFVSHVSHGKKSGENYATSFSNVNGSNKSSLGFYLTDNTYTGKNGYSLLLDGLEKGINDKARERAIVIHGADYSDPAKIGSSGGRLGRSLGCPALPPKLSRPIINTIKDGSVLFIYADNKNYLAKSSLLNSDTQNPTRSF